MKDLCITFKVNSTPREVFKAILNARGWWSKDLEGDSSELGDVFVYRHAEVHYSKHRLTEVIPYKKVVWLTIGSRLSFVKDEQEWNGTEVIFEIIENAGETTVVFTQRGLTPELACFQDCSKGWTYYMESLRLFILTGKGTSDQSKTKSIS